MIKSKGIRTRIQDHKAISPTIFMLIVGACLLSATISSPAHAETRQTSFSQIEKLFLEGKYEKVIYEADRLISSKYQLRDDVYYLKGLSELKLNRFNEARQSFQRIISRYAVSKRVFDAYLGVGDAYFLEGNIDGAIKTYNEILNRFPNDKNIGIVYNRLGGCYKRIGSSDKARYYLDKAKQISPLSFETKTSQNITEERQISMTSSQDPQFVPTKIPRNESRGYASVQVGSFKNRKNAEKLAMKLSREGYRAYVELPVGSGDRLYRVKVGRLNSKEEAESLASNLKSHGYGTKICSDDICR